jgi:hypothetical protein
MVVRSRVVRLRDVPQLLSAHRCHSNERVHCLAEFRAPGTGQFVRHRPAASSDLAGSRMTSNQTYPFMGTCEL